MTTDKELLEQAAKAAGMGLQWAEPEGCVKGGMVLGIQGCQNNCEYQGKDCDCDIFAYWNPLSSDGDALRLAVKLNLSMDLFDDEILVAYTPNCNDCAQVNEPSQPDPYAATRRAIVRAAAEIGRMM